MLYGENMTVSKLNKILEDLIKDGKGEIPIGLVSNNHTCEGDRDRFTVTECHMNFTNGPRNYIVIGNWDPSYNGIGRTTYDNINFKFDNVIWNNPL